MPFEPLTPEEEKWSKGCFDYQHRPPRKVVIREPVVWVCPMCGYRTVLRPRTNRMLIDVVDTDQLK